MFLKRYLFGKLDYGGYNRLEDSLKQALYFGFQRLIVYDFFIVCPKGRNLSYCNAKT